MVVEQFDEVRQQRHIATSGSVPPVSPPKSHIPRAWGVDAKIIFQVDAFGGVKKVANIRKPLAG